MSKLICLGIESTAHTFGVGIIDEDGKILADTRDMYESSTGIIPIEARKHHEEVADRLIKDALEQANLSFKDISFIAFSQGPGLSPSLIAGMNIAKELARRYNKDLIGVNHIEAHLEIGKLLSKAEDPIFVFVSGANTQIISYDHGYRVMGEALSIALGNALDKFARILDIGFPGGPKIEELARKSNNYIELPYVVKGMDVEFSGIITRARQLYEKGAKKEDLCYSLQETLFSMLVEITERALAHTQKKEALLIGGVAANKRLNFMLDKMCKDRKAIYYDVPLKYAGDNGINIAWQGIVDWKSGKRQTLDEIDIIPGWRIDQVN